MNAARLEELARIAEAITTDGYDPSLNGDLRDLARCARGWAKVEGQKASVTHQSGRWHCALGWFTHTIEATAIEAVEAAEVKP